MDEELKPCPFCSCTDIGEVPINPRLEPRHRRFKVYCKVCQCRTSEHKTRKEARIYWNTRAQLPSQWGEAVEWQHQAPDGSWWGIAKSRVDEARLAGRPIRPLYTHPADQVAQPDAELVELLRDARELIEHGDFREGHCMCGSAVEAHGFGDGHSPVDAGVYYAGQVMERIDAKLASLEVKP